VSLPHATSDSSHAAGGGSPAEDGRQHFYAYTNGISFNATTLTTNGITPTHQALSQRSGCLVGPGMSGAASNLSVTFNGLTSNTVYDAHIVLADFAAW